MTGPEATADLADDVDLTTVADLYATVLLIRRVEEEIARIYPGDEIKSPVHLSIGQEAVAAAVCRQMTADDVLYSTYRGHATYLAKGGDLDAMWAELFGRAGGCARGKAGSMHLVDATANVMGTSAIVASGIPTAVGHALALRMQCRADAVVCFFGEGATDEGVFHESVNFAALRRLPVVFVCENNGYAIYSPVASRMAGSLAERVASYGIDVTVVDDGDVLTMHAAAGAALAAVRAGAGPRFLEIATTRWRDHVGPGDDLHHGYRSAADLEAARRADQLPRLAGMLPAHLRAAIEIDVENAIARAVAFAQASPPPSAEELYANVFAD